MAVGLFTLSGCIKTATPGPQGPQGPQGPAGYNGNANVLGSDPFTVSSWSLTSDNSAYFASFTDPDITADVAARGVVEIYLYYPSDQTWRSLPDIVNGTQFYFRFSQGGFEIYYANVSGAAPSFPGTQVFRTVVISPSLKQAHPNANWKNYNEAVAALSEKAPASAQ